MSRGQPLCGLPSRQERHDTGHWDAILVDEGQVFSPDMAQVLLALLPSYGVLTVAQDEQQCLYQPKDSGWEKMGIAGLRLRRLQRQYRNTRATARMALRLLPEGEPVPELTGAVRARPLAGRDCAVAS